MTRRKPRKFVIENKTHWKTQHIRAFLRKAASQVFEDGDKPLIKVHVAYTRGQGRGSSGCAYVGGRTMTIRLDRDEPDKIDFAKVIAHEMGHLRGLTHKDMRGCARWRRLPGHREIYAWGETLPLEKREPKVEAKPAALGVNEHKRIKAAVKVNEWRRKVKAAQSRLKTWERKLRYYERRHEVIGQGKTAAAKPRPAITFEAAVRRAPMCLVGAIDLVGQHKTLADLAFMAQHELDLYEEGEPNDIRNDRDLKAVRNFLELCRGGAS